MGRPIRIEYPGALYHITSRGNERKDIFQDGPDREKFLDIVADYHDRFGIFVHAYALKDNHDNRAKSPKTCHCDPELDPGEAIPTI